MNKDMFNFVDAMGKNGWKNVNAEATPSELRFEFTKNGNNVFIRCTPTSLTSFWNCLWQIEETTKFKVRNLIYSADAIICCFATDNWRDELKALNAKGNKEAEYFYNMAMDDMN